MHTLKQSVGAMVLGLGALEFVAAPSLAQAWPQRAVRVIVPNPPGVGIDIIARLFAERLHARWGQPVAVENLPGADGIIAAREFIARNDDHTLLYSFGGLISINPLLHEKLPYDPNRDLVPIASTSENALAIAVTRSLAVDTLAELAQLARSRPGRLTWAATPGIPYFAFAAFQKSSGAEMQQASYRAFNQAIIDLGEGRIAAVAAGVAPLLPHARAGKIKLLAFINRERPPVAPEIPTVAEAGYPNLPVSGPTGFFGWRNMPNELRERIAADVREIAGETAIGERLAKIGSIVRRSTPAEFATAIEEQRASIAAVAKMIGTKPSR
ncbi:MAG: tripartite tricarboxylate transporter substrate binding protein [Hyphomicrobiales bacterium]|nr:tripartite tricarboxylate transporter substrate binding protein [Hyphomicrobiales bacterium]